MVKFSHSLQFNAVPDWASAYIAYSNLKKTLYAIEKYNIQTTIENGRPDDIEQGFARTVSSPTGISEKSQLGSSSRARRFLGLKGKNITEAAVASAAQEASQHNESDIFPRESAAFEQGLAKELSKVTSFYIRKERELSTELDAVDRQWQLEELKLNQETVGGTHVVENDDRGLEMTRRLSINIDDEKQLEDVEKSQLRRLMGYDKDGLIDQGTVVDMRSTTASQQVGGSTTVDGSVQDRSHVDSSSASDSITNADDQTSRSHKRVSLTGDLTEIVWRRGHLIESDNDEVSTAKTDKEDNMGRSDSALYIADSSEKRHAGTKNSDEAHHNFMDVPHLQIDDMSDLKRTHTQLTHKSSLNTHRSFSAMRSMLAGTNHHSRSNENLNHRPSLYAPLTTESLLRRRLIDTYVLLSELKSYVALNRVGFEKIIKKHDKLSGCHTLDRYMSTVVDLSPPFQAESHAHLDTQILRLQALYARYCTGGSMAQAAKELRSHLREYIVWERHTVWRDMVGKERKAEGARAVDAQERVPWKLFGHPIRFVTAADARRILFGLIGCTIFAILMSVSIFDSVEENRCFAILITVAFFWATEVFPLFATALLVPLLTILCQVMRNPVTKERLSTTAATALVFGYMFSPTIMLLLGGFTIAAALSKFGIAKAIASTVLSRAGTDPKWVLLANMFVATIASMFISNVAAPVLCYSLVQTILRNLPHKSSFGPCLIMGIALASDVGGMASPISSPQNIITIQNMSPAPSWGNWFAVSLPLCFVVDIIIWAWLILLWRPQRDTPTIPTIRATKEAFTVPKAFICLVTLGTIVLWCIENTFEETFGDMGVIAILPLIAFFGTGLLTKDDFNNFLWTVIMLAMGGIALGKAVDSSGLLDTIAHHIQQAIGGYSLWVVLLIFSALTLVFATFVSHTVAAVIILPIVQQVGMSFADPHPRLLVMGTGLVCSCAMGLPVSGFPNMTGSALEDEMGVPYLKTKDFLKSGVPLSILATLCILTIGYGIMSALGF
ncbi:low-affinity phosphate transporter [Dissophora globulifera]|nr:low-affinity phosphate transporter [Dissophora globulifera]